MSHHDEQRAGGTSTLHDQHTLRPIPPFKMFMKIKRAEGEQEVCSAQEPPCQTTTDNASQEPARCTTNTHFDLCPLQDVYEN